MEAEYPSKSINQWYERVEMLDRNFRESKRKKKEKKRKIEEEKKEKLKKEEQK